MAEQKINYDDVFSKDFNENLAKTLSILNDIEKTLQSVSKVKLKTSGGADAIKDNDKAITESLKNQKLLMDIEKKRSDIQRIKAKDEENLAKKLQQQHKDEEKIIKEKQKLWSDFEKQKQKDSENAQKQLDKEISLSEKTAAQRLKILENEEQKIKKQEEYKQKIYEKNKKLAEKDIQRAYADSEKSIKQTEIEAKKTEYLSRAYVILSKEHTAAANSLKDLIIRGKQGTQTQKEYDNELKNAQKQFDLLHDKVIKADHSVGQFNRHVGDYERALGGLKGTLMNLVGAFGVGSGIAIFANMLQGAFNTIKEFDKKVSELQAITGASGKDLDFLKDKAIEMAAGFGDSAANIIEAMKLVGSAKPELLENVEALSQMTEAVITLSKASGMDLATSTDNLTKIMNQFNHSAEMANTDINILAAGSKFGAVEVGYLGQAITKVGTVANAAGLSLETTVAAMELFGEKGVQAETAGNGFKTILVKLQADTKNYTNGLFDLNKAIANNKSISTDNIALQKKFGLEYFSLAQILLTNSERFEQLNKQVTGTNTAFEQALVATNNLSGDIDKLAGGYDAFILSLENGQGTIGKSLREVVQFFTELLRTTKVLEENGGKNLSNLQKLGITSQYYADGVKEINKQLTENLKLEKERSGRGLIGKSVNETQRQIDFVLEEIKKETEQHKKLLTAESEIGNTIFEKLSMQEQIQVAADEQLSSKRLEILYKTYDALSKQRDGIKEVVKVKEEEITVDEKAILTEKEKEKQRKKSIQDEKDKAKLIQDGIDAENEAFRRKERFEKDKVEPLIGLSLSDSQKKETKKKITADLLQLRKDVSQDLAEEPFIGFDLFMMRLLEVDEEDLQSVYDSLNSIKENGLDIFNEINEANQQRTESAISESEKRIQALQNEYDAEKTLQQQRQEAGKAYDTKKLEQIKIQQAAEEAEKLKQEEKLKKFQKRQLLTQIIIDEASSLSSAIVAAFGNPLNKFTFGAAGIAQLAAMTLQLGAAFFKVRGALEKFEDGGLIGGQRHSNGGTIIEAEQGEFITNRKATSKSSKLLNMVNDGKITDKHLQYLINPMIPVSENGSTWNTSIMENLLSEQISVNKKGFGKLDEKSYIENGFKVVRKNGLTIRYK